MNDSIARLAAALADRYRIERELGAGGMATVYLAHDLRHDRHVALKVLRPELSAILGAERFLHEIRTTANLQHPHVLSLYDSGEADGLVFYVMPFVEGESLRDRLQREKQLPVDDAVRIAHDVAEALDYAHRHGVIHRDIKPENILLHDGRALVADFGIALAVSRSDGGTRMTETGMSLGTPHYMSPEQAMGEREITPKADVYALGCVLYEMLAGEPPFTGPTAQAIIARVMTEEPRSLTLQRRTIPPHVEAAAQTALAKLPADRFATAAQFAAALEGRGPGTATLARAAAAPARSRPAPLALALGGGIVLAIGALAGRALGPRSPEPLPARFSITLPASAPLATAAIGSVALSPDGRTIVYVGEGPSITQLFARPLDDVQARPIAGSESAILPSFSPDGATIGFLAGAIHRHVPLSGGTGVGSTALTGLGGLWLGADRFFLADPAGRLIARGPGDAAELILAPDSAAGEVALIPMDRLPDGRILVVAFSQGLTGAMLLVDPARRSRRQVSATAVAAAAWRDGFLAWVLPTGELQAARFDPDDDAPPGSATTLATDVRVTPGTPPQIAFSRTGSLVYVPAQPSDLVLVDRSGRTEVLSAARRFHSPRLSPDGSRIAMDISDATRDLWLLDRRDGSLARISFENDAHDPQWMPDGRSVLFASARGSAIGIFRRRVDGVGTPESVLVRGIQLTAHAVSRDGARALAAEFSGAGDFNLVWVPLQGAERQTVPLAATSFNEESPSLSPDGRWVAYATNETGRPEVYLRPLAGEGGKVLVSLGGGTEPVFARDGRELYYRDATGGLVAAAVVLGAEARVTARTRLFDTAIFETATPHANYDVAPDGRFVFVRQQRATHLMFIQNWTALVR